MKKNATKTARNSSKETQSDRTREEGLQLTVQLPELFYEELHAVVTRLGLHALQGVLQREVGELCGEAYQRGQGDRPSRSGSAPGSLALGGRRVEVKRPRVRQDGREVPLPTWEALAGDDPLHARAVEQMVIGVSTRKYRRSLEEMPREVVARGTSKSAVSRRFVAATGKKLDEWMRRDLSTLEIAVIMIDGIYIDDHVVLVALGFGKTGDKHILGMHEGATENAEACRTLLAELVDRGIDSSRSRLFVIDGSKALRRAVGRVEVKVAEQLEEIRKRADAAERGRDLRAVSREQDRDNRARDGEQERWRRATEAEKQAAAREQQRDERAARWDLEAAERERQRDAQAAEAERRRTQSAAATEQARAETASQSTAQFFRELQRQQAEFDADCKARMREIEESMRAFNDRWSTPRPGPPAAPGSVAARMKRLYDDTDDS